MNDGHHLAGDEYSPWRTSYGILIPDWMKGMPLAQQHVYAALARIAGPPGYCWPTVKRIAEEAGISERTAYSALDGLRACKLVRTKRRGMGKPNLITFLKPTAIFADQELQPLQIKNCKSRSSRTAIFAVPRASASVLGMESESKQTESNKMSAVASDTPTPHVSADQFQPPAGQSGNPAIGPSVPVAGDGCGAFSPAPGQCPAGGSFSGAPSGINGRAKTRGNPPPEEAVVMAAKIVEAMEAVQRVVVVPVRRREWADQCRKIAELDRVSYERQAAAWAWHVAHLDREYCHVVHSGAAWRKKFLNIEEAMKRASRPPPETKEQRTTREIREHEARLAEQDKKLLEQRSLGL